jgi:hypothetical protein
LRLFVQKHQRAANSHRRKQNAILAPEIALDFLDMRRPGTAA